MAAFRYALPSARRLVLLSVVAVVCLQQHSSAAQQERPPLKLEPLETQPPELQSYKQSPENPRSQPGPQRQSQQWPQPQQQPILEPLPQQQLKLEPHPQQQPILEPHPKQQPKLELQPQQQPKLELHSQQQLIDHQSGRACYQSTRTPYVYFNSKTNYGMVAGNDLHTPSDCRPTQVWMVSRHGTRYPSHEDIDELKKLNYLKTMITVNSTLCPEDIDAIKNWDINIDENDQYMLHSQGIEELKSLATRLKTQFPQIFNTSYSDDKFKFLSTHKPRAKDSATTFYQSLFNQNPEKALPVGKKSDERIYLSKCTHVGEDDDNEKGQGEVKQFKEGPLVNSVVSRVSMAMGLQRNLSYENVSLMLMSCKYEKAWNIQSRPAWCALFTQRDFEIFEYLEDLKYYYQYGYGNPNSKNIGCPIVKDLIDNFKDQASDKNGPLGVFYFGHSPNVFSLATQLGVAKDSTPLLSTNFEQMKNRKWRTTFIDPFASNVIAVFYKCAGGNKKTMFLLNEHSIPMGDNQCLLCPWESVETQFGPITSDDHACNLNACQL